LNIIFSTGLDGDAGASTFTGIFIGFFWTGTDSRVRQEYYYESATSTAMTAAYADFNVNPPVGNGTDSFTNDQSGVTLLVKPDVTASAVNDWVLFVLPYGTQFGSTTFTLPTDGFGTVTTIFSTNRLFKFPTAWAK